MAKDITVALTLDNKQFDKGIKQSQRNAGKFAKQTTSEVTGLTNAFRLLAGAIGVQQIIKYADGITNLKNKLLTLNPNAAAVAEQFDRIRQIAINSRADLDGVGDLYFRIARAQTELGITGEETAQIVESVSKAITASGLSAQEAQGPLLQLGQALQSGRFQGDELRSILEGLPDVARALARSLNVPIGKLKDLGSQGLITGKVFVDAMRQAKEGIDIAFGNTEVTIGQGFQLVQTSFSGLVNTIGNSTGVFTSIAESLVSISKGIEALASSTDAIKSFGTAIVAVIGSLFLFRSAISIIRMPIKTFAADSLFLAKGVEKLTGNMKLLSGGAKNAFDRLSGAKPVGNAFLSTFGRIAVMLRSVVGIISGPLGLALAIFGLTKAMQGLNDIKEQNLIDKIASQGAAKTIEEINRLELAILQLKKATITDNFGGMGILGGSLNLSENKNQIELYQKRIDELFKTLDMKSKGELLGFIGIKSETDTQIQQTADAINKLLLSLTGMTRSPQGLTDALAAFQALVGDPKTNEDFRIYEESIRKIYAAFGESVPTDEFDKLKESIADVTSFDAMDAVLTQTVELMKQNKISADEYIEALALLRGAVAHLSPVFEVFKDAMSEAGNALGDDLAEALVEGEDAMDAFKNAFKDVVKKVIAEAIKLMIVRQLMQSIFGMMGYNVEFGSGASIANITKAPPMADGGAVTNNKPYMVGEEGPELFVPSSNGTIIPNGAGGGSTTNNYITNNISALDSRSVAQVFAENSQAMLGTVEYARKQTSYGV